MAFLLEFGDFSALVKGVSGLSVFRFNEITRKISQVKF
jgi:hypothetical protein